MSIPDHIAANYDERVALGETYASIGRQAAADGYADVAAYCAEKAAEAGDVKPVKVAFDEAPLERAVAPDKA